MRGKVQFWWPRFWVVKRIINDFIPTSRVTNRWVPYHDPIFIFAINQRLDDCFILSFCYCVTHLSTVLYEEATHKIVHTNLIYSRRRGCYRTQVPTFTAIKRSFIWRNTYALWFLPESLVRCCWRPPLLVFFRWVPTVSIDEPRFNRPVSLRSEQWPLAVSWSPIHRLRSTQSIPLQLWRMDRNFHHDSLWNEPRRTYFFRGLIFKVETTQKKSMLKKPKQKPEKPSIIKYIY